MDYFKKRRETLEERLNKILIEQGQRLTKLEENRRCLEDALLSKRAAFDFMLQKLDEEYKKLNN